MGIKFSRTSDQPTMIAKPNFIEYPDEYVVVHKCFDTDQTDCIYTREQWEQLGKCRRNDRRLERLY